MWITVLLWWLCNSNHQQSANSMGQCLILGEGVEECTWGCAKELSIWRFKSNQRFILNVAFFFYVWGMQGPKLHKLKSRNSPSSAAVCTEPLGACINCSHRADTSTWHMLTFTRHFLHRCIMSKAKLPVIHSLPIN